MEDINTDDQADRIAVCRAIEQEFNLSETAVTGAVFLAADWRGEPHPGAVILVQTGDALAAGSAEPEARQSWLNVNDRLEEQGVDLYSEIKSASVTAFYRFS